MKQCCYAGPSVRMVKKAEKEPGKNVSGPMMAVLCSPELVHELQHISLATVCS